MNENIIYYYDSEALDDMYCNEHNCHSCDGTDMSGEPNGYGCDAREDATMKLIESGKYDEIPTDGNSKKLFVSLDDYEELKKENKEIKELAGEIYTNDRQKCLGCSIPSKNRGLQKKLETAIGYIESLAHMPILIHSETVKSTAIKILKEIK